MGHHTWCIAVCYVMLVKMLRTKLEKDDNDGVDGDSIRQVDNICKKTMVESLAMRMNLIALRYCCCCCCGGVRVELMRGVAITMLVDNRCCWLAMVEILRRISMMLVMLMVIGCCGNDVVGVGDDGC